MKACAPLSLGLILLLAPAAPAQSALPLVEDVPFAAVRDQGQALLKALEELKAPLPAEVEQELTSLIRAGEQGPEAAEKLQRLLDQRCLCGVTINPESRVKAARGPLAAELRRDRPNYVLIKVHNDAGVTAGLKISGPQFRNGGEGEDRWLEAAVQTPAPLRERLSGARLEYVLVKLTPHETGKREATLRFDVGQGTQDLGFRAEVPILFIIK